MKRFSILITRAMPEAEEVAQHIVALGHLPILAPLQQAEAVPSPLPDQKPDRLIATSARAFHSGSQAPAEWLTLPLHVVGEATARAAQKAGFTQLHVAKGEAKSLLSDILSMPRSKERLLYLAGEPRRDEVETGLRAAGHDLTTIIRYRMVGVQNVPDAMRDALHTGQCDIILHFSALSAQRAIHLAGQAKLLEEFARLTHLCLSVAIAHVVEAESAPRIPRILSAKKPDLPSLLDILTTLKL